MQIAHAVTELDGRFVEVDDAFCSLLHLSHRDVMKQTIFSVTHSAHRNSNERLLNGLLTHGAGFVIEKDYVRADGQSVRVRNSVSRVLNAYGNARIAASVVAITIEKTIDQMLNEAHARAVGLRQRTEQIKRMIEGASRP